MRKLFSQSDKPATKVYSYKYDHLTCITSYIVRDLNVRGPPRLDETLHQLRPILGQHPLTLLTQYAHTTTLVKFAICFCLGLIYTNIRRIKRFWLRLFLHISCYYRNCNDYQVNRFSRVPSVKVVFNI